MSAEVASEWLEVADRDHRAAEYLLADDPPQIEVAIYHVQQFVEKLLKGLLVSEGIHPPHTHDLERLAARLPVNHPLAADVAKVDGVTGWAVMARYPDLDPSTADPLPSPDAVRNVLVDAVALRAKVAASISL